MFSCEYCKISNNTCFEEHLQMAASENNKNRSSVSNYNGDNSETILILCHISDSATA